LQTLGGQFGEALAEPIETGQAAVIFKRKHEDRCRMVFDGRGARSAFRLLIWRRLRATCRKKNGANNQEPTPEKSRGHCEHIVAEAVRRVIVQTLAGSK